MIWREDTEFSVNGTGFDALRKLCYVGKQIYFAVETTLGSCKYKWPCKSEPRYSRKQRAKKEFLMVKKSVR